MYGKISNQKPPMYEEIAEAEMATANEDRHQIKIVEGNEVRHITSPHKS